MSRVRQLLQSTFWVILFLGLNKITGLIRNDLVANQFGTGVEMDAFTAANQLPELFFTLIAGGALAAAFIPVYTAYLTDEKTKEATRLLHTTLTLVLLILGVVAGLAILFASQIVLVLTPDFPPAQQQLTAELMQIILLQTMLFGISGVLSSFLNAHQHFALPALASMALDVGYVVGLYAFVPTLGIHGLAWGTVVSGVVHIAVQIPALVKYGFSYRPGLAWELPGVQEIIRLMGPRVVTLGIIQFADLFIIRLASGLATGSTSAYFFGYMLMQLPETLFGTAIAVVLFPTMSELYNTGRMAELKQAAVTALRIIWALTIPSAVGLVLLGRPLIALLLEGGAFTSDSTNLVYQVLLFMSVRIVSEATLEVVARLFYARHNTRTPMFVYLGWFAIQVSGAYLFVGSLGVAGLALASTAAFTVLAAVLYVLNSRELGGLGEKELAISGGRALLASAGMAVVIMGLQQLLPGSLLFLAAGAGLGGVVYILLLTLLGAPELGQLWQLVRYRPSQN
jgi:putative peptidoglycan lipid II flippase